MKLEMHTGPLHGSYMTITLTILTGLSGHYSHIKHEFTLVGADTSDIEEWLASSARIIEEQNPEATGVLRELNQKFLTLIGDMVSALQAIIERRHERSTHLGSSAFTAKTA